MSVRDHLIHATAHVIKVAQKANVHETLRMHIVCANPDVYFRMLREIDSDREIFHQPGMDRGEWMVNGMIFALVKGWE